MKIHLEDNAQPHPVKVARQIPFMLQKENKQELDDPCSKNTIRPLEDEPTEWCHPMVVVPKLKGAEKLSGDFTKMGKFVKRPMHSAKTPKEAVGAINPRAKFFGTFDASKGYWQMSLDEEAQNITTFMTPWGRFQYLRLPMWLSSTGDEYSQRVDVAFEDIKNMHKVVDDTILYDEDLKSHIQNVRKFLQCCRENNITLNKIKINLAQKKVEFVGYVISENSISPYPKKIKAIQDFPVARAPTPGIWLLGGWLAEWLTRARVCSVYVQLCGWQAGLLLWECVHTYVAAVVLLK